MHTYALSSLTHSFSNPKFHTMSVKLRAFSILFFSSRSAHDSWVPVQQAVFIDISLCVRESVSVSVSAVCDMKAPNTHNTNTHGRKCSHEPFIPRTQREPFNMLLSCVHTLLLLPYVHVALSLLHLRYLAEATKFDIAMCVWCSVLVSSDRNTRENNKKSKHIPMNLQRRWNCEGSEAKVMNDFLCQKRKIFSLRIQNILVLCVSYSKEPKKILGGVWGFWTTEIQIGLKKLQLALESSKPPLGLWWGCQCLHKENFLCNFVICMVKCENCFEKIENKTLSFFTSLHS